MFICGIFDLAGYDVYKVAAITLAVIMVSMVLLSIVSLTIKNKIDKARDISNNVCALSNVYLEDKKKSAERILVIGDSIIAGCGIFNCEKTIPHGLSKYFVTDVDIVAMPGWKIRDVYNTVHISGTKVEKYKKIIVQIGANDVISTSSLYDVEKDFVELYKLLSPHVATPSDIIFLFPENGWKKPILKFPVNLYVKNRAKYLQKILEKQQKVWDFTLIEEGVKKYVEELIEHLNDAGIGKRAFVDLKTPH
jgi:lysophospholipase L1-like esterase